MFLHSSLNLSSHFSPFPPSPHSSPLHSIIIMVSESVSYDHIFKIILVGDNGVGKSSIIRRFCEGTYTHDMDTTIGVDFYLSEIDVSGKKIKVIHINRHIYLLTQSACLLYLMLTSKPILYTSSLLL